MKNIEIFDPAMCCSTGVCGPSIDEDLLRISTVINSLKEKGIDIKRYGLGSEPFEFISNQVVNDALSKGGADILPITLVNGEIVKTKTYPTNDELSEWLGVEIEIEQHKKSNTSCDGSKGCC